MRDKPGKCYGSTAVSKTAGASSTLAPGAILVAALLLALGWLAVMSLPRAEVEPEAVLEEEFNSAKVGIATALRDHLKDELVALKAPPLHINMEISLTPRADGDYDIQIDWHVYDAERALGTVRQSNVLPGWYVNRGWHSADSGTWSAAAYAAAKGVMRLLKRQGEDT